MTRNKKQRFWIPVRVLEAKPNASSALIVPSFVCLCLYGQRFSPKWLRTLLSKIRFEKSTIERANERWESLMVSLLLVAPHSSLHKEERDVTAVRRLFRWYISSLVHCGQDWLDKRLKTMFENSRHLSGLPVQQNSKLDVPSGTPGFDGQTFVGFPFFAKSSWEILNQVPKELGWGIEAHWAFSLGKRAMGFPTTSKRISSIEKFRDRTSLVRDPSERVLEEAREFAYQYGNKFPDWKIKSNLNIHISFSTSSCMEVGRNKGGRIEFCKQRLEEFDQTYYIFPKGSTIFGPSGDVLVDVLDEANQLMILKDSGDDYVILGQSLRFTLGDQRIIREISFAECSSDDTIPLELVTDPVSSFESDNFTFHLFDESPVYSVPDFTEAEILMRLDAVDDDGAKARVIGVSQGSYINLAHLIRTLITSVIKCDRQVPTMGWRGKKPDRTLSSSGLFDSADLTAATDCSSIREVRNLLKGLCASLLERELVPSWLEGNLMTLCDLVMRSQEVHAPPWWKGPSIFPFSTLRSVPMGQPHSWVLLCIGQLYHRKRSMLAVKQTLPDPSKYKLTVCGDDTGSSGNSLESCFMFRVSLRNSGYELSSGTDIISEHVVHFTEQMFVRDTSCAGPLKQVLFPFGKSLISKNLPQRLPFKRKKNEKTSYTSRGPATTLATSSVSLPFSGEGWSELLVKACRLYSLYSNHKILEKAKDLDLPLYVPVEFGGLGFPHPSNKGFRHTRPFYLKGISSLLMENRNIEYILNFRTLGSFWSFSPGNEAQAETKRLNDHWVQSVFSPHRKVRGEHDLNLIKEDPHSPLCWVDVQDMSQFFNIPLEVGDWDSYDRIKESIGLSTDRKWFPIKETLDHVEAGFRNEALFRATQSDSVVPSLASISKRVHIFYQRRMEDYPPTQSWRNLKDRSVSDVLDILHWRQNLVLVSSSLPKLENFSSRW